MVELTTERLLIRDPSLGDFGSYHALMSDPSIMYYLRDIMTGSDAESRLSLEQAVLEAKSANRTCYFFSIIDITGIIADSGGYVGQIGYTVTDRSPAGSFVHMGYFIRREYWGKGIVTEALRAVTDYAFREGGVCRISTGCAKDNGASERVMIKCGYTKEADRKDYFWLDGALRDRVEYRMLRSEWERLCNLY